MSDLTPGPWAIEYHPWPCPKNGQGEPNPPAAFVGPSGSDDAIALVFGHGDDPFDSPNQRANAALIAAAPDLLAAAKDAVDRIRAYADVLKQSRIPYPLGLADAMTRLDTAIARATGGKP